VLQVSSAHVYLTYPFVLSWSLIEALSTGCVVIGSDTPPVREVIDGRNGILVPFFDTDRLAAAAIEALAHPRQFADMRVRARRTVLDQYDVERKCLPQFLALLRGTTLRSPRKLQRASVRRRAARRAKRRKEVWHGLPATRGRGADAIRD
jgi:glycosyltransferase involved in cell wall biosynthesis